MLPMLDARHDLPLGGCVATQLVGDQHTRRSPLLLQQLAQQALGRLLVAPALNQDIENEALLVDGAPEPMLRAGNGNDHLVEVPLVAALRGAPPDAVGEFLAEFQAPLPDRLVGHRDAARRQHLLDHAQAQREAEIEPHRIADEFSRIAIAGVKRISGRRHSARIPDHRQLAKPDAAQLDGAPLTLGAHAVSGANCQLRRFWVLVLPPDAPVNPTYAWSPV